MGVVFCDLYSLVVSCEAKLSRKSAFGKPKWLLFLKVGAQNG
jgi:hypothetical protein